MSKNIVKVFETVMMVNENGEVEFGTKFNQDFFEHMNIDIYKVQEKLTPVYDDIIKGVNQASE